MSKILPSIPVQIDWSNPMTNGLVLAYVPGFSGPNELTQLGAPKMTYNSTCSFDMTKEGPSLKTIAQTTVVGPFALLQATHPAVTANSVTIYWRGYVTNVSTGTNYPPLAGIYENGSFKPHMSLIAGSPSAVYTEWNTGGTATFGANFTVANNQFCGIGATFVVGGSVQGYLNGVTAGSSTSFGASAPTVSTPAACFGGDPTSPYDTHAVSTNLFFYWNRAFSAVEMANLDRNPYGFLIPSNQLSTLSGIVAHISGVTARRRYFAVT